MDPVGPQEKMAGGDPSQLPGRLAPNTRWSLGISIAMGYPAGCFRMDDPMKSLGHQEYLISFGYKVNRRHYRFEFEFWGFT